MTARPLRAAPVLSVADVAASARWYAASLGFEVAGLWGEPPGFGIVRRGAVTLMLDGGRADDAPPRANDGWAAYIYVDDIAALVEDLRARGTPIQRGPADAFYGCREIDVRDPDGHVLCLAQDLDPGPEGPGL